MLSDLRTLYNEIIPRSLLYSSLSHAEGMIASAMRLLVEECHHFVDSARWAIKAAWSTHAWLLLGLGLITLAGGMFPAALALMIRHVIDAAVGGGGSQGETWTQILPWLIFALVLTAAEAVSSLFYRFLMQLFTDDLELHLTSHILQHAARLDVAFFEDPRFQDVIHRARQNTANHFAQFWTHGLTFTTQLVQSVSLLAVLVAIEPFVVVVLLPFAGTHLFWQWRIAKRHYEEEYQRTTKRRWSQYFVSLLTTRRSVPEVKLLNLAPLLHEIFQTLMTAIRDQNRKRYLNSFTAGTVITLVTATVFYIMFASVLHRFLEGLLTVGDLAIFGTVGLRLRGTLESAVLSLTNAFRHTLYVANLREFLNVQPRINGTSGRKPSAAKGELEFRNVSFTYPGTAVPVLSNVSLRIGPGETVALVGENGAGKTTLVKLIARFYDPDVGGIFYDGVDLREFALDALHRQIAFVFQGSSPYEATAADNIAYGDWHRLLYDRAQVARIAQDAGVDKLIERMPQGYETLLGRRFGEYDISGGQWQHLAIARALARDAALLILDEPSSNLDAKTEYEVFQRFRELARDKTAILVSHRFSTVRMADRIIVLDKGGIVETGTHCELIARGGCYARLYQFHQRQTGNW